jgi:hypothetical protein
MNVIPRRNYGAEDLQEMTSLIDPDDQGIWAVRYLWIQHTQDNNKFYNNYFDPALAQTGMNVRKQTANLKNDWTAHNQIFHDSAANGDLVWRVKIGNPTSRSIDYIEIWRSVKTVEQHFGDNPNQTWPKDNRKSFNQQLFEAGFEIRSWYPYRTISNKLAIDYYNKFVDQHKNKQHCIINTPWRKDINPV